MVSKLSIVFLLLFVCQVFSARIPRDSDATAKPAPASVQSTPKANDSSEESSEDSKEDFEKMKASVKELLNEAEKKEFDDVVNGLEKAKTLEESLTGIGKLITFVVEASVKHSGSTTTPSITENTI